MKLIIKKLDNERREIIAMSGDPRNAKLETARNVGPEEFHAKVVELIAKVDPSPPSPGPA